MQKLIESLTAAHLNALNSTLHAVEVQTAAIKTLLASYPPQAADAAPAPKGADPAPKKTAPKKPAAKRAAAQPVQEEEEFDLDITEEEELENTEETESTEETEESSETPSLEDVITAFQNYAMKHSRDKAGLVMGKLKIKNVRDLKPAQYPQALAMLR